MNFFVFSRGAVGRLHRLVMRGEPKVTTKNVAPYQLGAPSPMAPG